MLVSIGLASKIIGVSISTLRRWEKENLLASTLRTLGNHRRYCLKRIKEIFNLNHNKAEKEDVRSTVCYAGVSSHDQKNDLKTQSQRLKKYCQNNKIHSDLVTDLGSGINFKKPGLKKIIQGICSNKIGHIILVHRDRLVRFAFPLIQLLCEFYSVKLTVLEEQSLSFQEEVVRDVIEIMTVCSARIYGKRSHQNVLAA